MNSGYGYDNPSLVYKSTPYSSYVTNSGSSSNSGSSGSSSYTSSGQSAFDYYASQPSLRDKLSNQTAFNASKTAALQTSPRVTGYNTVKYGEPQYNAALINWEKVYADAKQGLPKALAVLNEFAPGGSYGTGQRLQAKETVQQGLGQDTVNAIGSGMSSTANARGLSTLAGSELAKLYGNIEDQRAQLELSAMSPYTQILSLITNAGLARPNYLDHVQIQQVPRYS